MAAQVDGDQPEVAREGVLVAEEGAVGHQAVQQHQRTAFAFLFIGDSRAVAGGEMLQTILPAAPLPTGVSAEPPACLNMKPESIFTSGGLLMGRLRAARGDERQTRAPKEGGTRRRLLEAAALEFASAAISAAITASPSGPARARTFYTIARARRSVPLWSRHEPRVRSHVADRSRLSHRLAAERIGLGVHLLVRRQASSTVSRMRIRLPLAYRESLSLRRRYRRNLAPRAPREIAPAQCTRGRRRSPVP